MKNNESSSTTNKGEKKTHFFPQVHSDPKINKTQNFLNTTI